MCQAIPRKVLETDATGSRARVDLDGEPTWVEAASLPGLQIGEYVVVYAGQALERMETAEAEEMLDWYANLEQMLADAAA